MSSDLSSSGYIILLKPMAWHLSSVWENSQPLFLLILLLPHFSLSSSDSAMLDLYNISHVFHVLFCIHHSF